MRQLIMILMASSLFFSCKNDKKTTRDDRRTETDREIDGKEDDRDKSTKWTSGDISDFNRECEKTMKDNDKLSTRQIGEICDCLLDKFQGKYDTYADMDKNASYDEGKAAGEDCMKDIMGGAATKDDDTDNGSGWTSADKRKWMDLCDETVKSSAMNADKKQEYCSCVLDKLQTRYSTFDKMNMQGTEEEGIELGKACIKQMGLQ